ncbi:unnamed protein product [Paramecium octaurelia]|uniref:Uncharacterized protein n=1 Tax=Paramecium octaurelia TaxID=43137 RepID=A0A8S1XQ66_PAROT|nr:unnamed protein product [Paramecium octaurelia]
MVQKYACLGINGKTNKNFIIYTNKTNQILLVLLLSVEAEFAIGTITLRRACNVMNFITNSACKLKPNF